MMSHCDIAIVGAGPYGLSLAAFLNARGISVRVFGKAMGFWLDNMPTGMHLKSDGFASNLYDPDRIYALKQFCLEQGLSYHDTSIPVSLEIFTNYGLAFQKRFVPNLQQSTVVKLTDNAKGFELTLDNGQSVTARRVVIAVGIQCFRNMPVTLEHLTPDFASHSSDHHDLGLFAKRNVVVLGAGASATDVAALLHEAGAAVQLVARKPNIQFHSPGGSGRRSLWKEIRYPSSGIGPGWRHRFYCEAPPPFHLLKRPRSKAARCITREAKAGDGFFFAGRPARLNK